MLQVIEGWFKDILIHVKLLPMGECQEEWLERDRSNPLQCSPNSYDR
jgi:hypothetical protein